MRVATSTARGLDFCLGHRRQGRLRGQKTEDRSRTLPEAHDEGIIGRAAPAARVPNCADLGWPASVSPTIRPGPDWDR